MMTHDQSQKRPHQNSVWRVGDEDEKVTISHDFTCKGNLHQSGVNTESNHQ